MSRTYEMASGYVASPDGRAVDNGSTVVIRLSGDVNGTIVPATDLRRADGTAWPTEGVVTDENGKVVVQVPGAGPYPAMLWSDTGRGLWPMPPTDLSARQAALEAAAARVVDGVLVDPDGTEIEVGGEVTPEDVAAAGEGVFVLTAQAATVVFDWDVNNTGDLVISNGIKTARIAFVDGVLQGGSGDDAPPTADYEADVDFRWDSAHMPTGSPTTNLWPATKPSSGGPIIQWFGVGNHSGPAVAAFGSDPGYTIGVDGARVDLGSLRSVEPAGTGGGFVAMSCKNLLWDSGAAGTGDTAWVLSLYGRDTLDANNLRRVQAALYYTGGGWNWRVRVFNGTTDVVLATVPVQVNVVDFPDDNQHGVGGPMVLAWKLAGPSSKFIIASAEGTQTIPVDLTGIGDYKFIYFTEEPSGIERTTVTMKKVVAGADNFTDAKVTAAIADLAADAHFTIGA